MVWRLQDYGDMEMRDKIYLSDCRSLGYCVRGIKRFCASNGIDFRDFVRNGIERERLVALRQHLSDELVRRCDGR